MKTNKKTIVRRLASLVLVALLLVTALSACTGKQQVVKPTVNSDVFLSIDENCSLTASVLAFAQSLNELLSGTCMFLATPPSNTQSLQIDGKQGWCTCPVKGCNAALPPNHGQSYPGAEKVQG